MNEKRLLQVSLIVSGIGILIIFLISNNIDVNDTTIRKINSEELSGDYVLQGKVVDVVSGNGFSRIKLVQEETVEVIVFDNVSIESGNDVEIIAKVSDDSIIAQRIDILTHLR